MSSHCFVARVRTTEAIEAVRALSQITAPGFRETINILNPRTLASLGLLFRV